MWRLETLAPTDHSSVINNSILVEHSQILVINIDIGLIEATLKY